MILDTFLFKVIKDNIEEYTPTPPHLCIPGL